jgi:hypothetical protein
MFRPDVPIVSSKDDLLAGDSFSQALADAILAHGNKDSVVTTMYGAWGWGDVYQGALRFFFGTIRGVTGLGSQHAFHRPIK